MNISFPENWQYNHKLTLLHTYQDRKIALKIRQNIKVIGSLVNWEKFGSTASVNIQKSHYSTWAKLNSSFQYFSKSGKRLKYSLRPKHKTPVLNLRIIWKIMCEFEFTVENLGNLQEIRWEKSIVHFEKQNLEHIGNSVCMPQNIWLLERPWVSI